MGTGVLGLLGRGVENRMYGVVQTRTRLLGKRTLSVPSQFPTSRHNLQIELKPARPSRFKGYVYRPESGEEYGPSFEGCGDCLDF